MLFSEYQIISFILVECRILVKSKNIVLKKINQDITKIKYYPQDTRTLLKYKYKYRLSILAQISLKRIVDSKISLRLRDKIKLKHEAGKMDGYETELPILELRGNWIWNTSSRADSTWLLASSALSTVVRRKIAPIDTWNDVSQLGVP